MYPRALVFLVSAACAGAPRGAVAPPSSPVPPAYTAPASPANPGVRLADLRIPGDPRLARVARDVLELRFGLVPNLPAESGLLEDAIRVPSFTPEAVRAQIAAADAALAALAALPVAELSLAEQVDIRLLRANAEEARYRLAVERRWTHRPAEWLEPVAGVYVALAVLAPERRDLPLALAHLVPAMCAEARAEVTEPTERDIATALDLIDSIGLAVAPYPEAADARAALADLRAVYAGYTGLPAYRVVGPEAYAWRLEHALLLPWTPDTLLAEAGRALSAVDAELAELAVVDPVAPAAPPTDAERAAAEALDRDGLMALYDGAVAQNLASLRQMGVLTVPAELPALHARETPDALLPFTGDGGSMNPPPLFGPATVGWWNVQHFQPSWTEATRQGLVLDAWRQNESGFGTYAVHEGVPGHHLQLALARANPDPVRTLLADTPSVEGWALYAEQLFWEGGGFGPSAAAHRMMLNSYRGRIRRVYYDVNVETGRWTLEEAAAWRADSPGAPVDLDVLRAIQWPTQLISYFAGKQAILSLRAEVRAEQGPAYSERAFHDALLAAGPIPLALVRAELLQDASLIPR